MKGSSDRGHDALAALTVAVERLTDHIRLLIGVVDELTSEVQWRNNQVIGRSEQRPFALKSMPVDPAAADWQINRAPQAASSLPSPPSHATRPRTLFE